MKRFDIINHYIQKYNYQSYLEIGCQWGINLREIVCPNKLAVDPDSKSAADIKITSDEFFRLYHKTWDIIFIDGLHIESQVDRDIQNSLNSLTSNGTIVMHDLNPKAEKHQLETWDGSCPWNGSSWRSFVKLRATRPDLEMFVVDTDYGCGVIRHGRQDCIKLPEVLTYKDLELNREYMLRLITTEHFKNAC
jgi:hypothetical protein